MSGEGFQVWLLLLGASTSRNDNENLGSEVFMFKASSSSLPLRFCTRQKNVDTVLVVLKSCQMMRKLIGLLIVNRDRLLLGFPSRWCPFGCCPSHIEVIILRLGLLPISHPRNHVNIFIHDLGPLYIRAHLELGPFGLEAGLNFSHTLQSGP